VAFDYHYKAVVAESESFLGFEAVDITNGYDHLLSARDLFIVIDSPLFCREAERT
jgi:hypothetical protein